MSGIRVNEWLHNSGTGGIWQTSAGNVGIASSVPTTKLEVTGDAKVSGICTAATFVPSEGALSNRRLNVNGAFTVSQKNGSTAKTSISGSDRWVDLIQHYSSNGGTFTVQRVSDDAPTGYQYSAKYTVTTPNSSLAVGDEDMVIHRIEGQDLAHLSWGSASAKTITLSFWVKSSLTGDFSVALQGGGGRCYVTAYTISSADTWEQKTVTIPGETSGTWVINANAGLAIIWDLGAGSTYEASSAATWLSVANVYRKAGTVRYSATNTATWQITGIQFEVGSVATPFEHRNYSDELARCMRYYQQWGASGQDGNFCVGASHLTSGGDQTRNASMLPTMLRAAPTITEFGNGLKVFGSGSEVAVTNIQDINVTNGSNMLCWTCEHSDIGDNNEIGVVCNTDNGGAYLDAEL